MNERRLTTRVRWGSSLGIAGLVVLSWLYCQPGHPSAGDAYLIDALLHCMLFAAIGLWFACATRARRAMLPLLILLAIGLEWLQWCRGGHAGLEYGDIACNVLGATLGWCVGKSSNGSPSQNR